MADEHNMKEKKRRFRKAGRTLLIKPVNNGFDFDSLELDNHEGLKSNILTKSGARFLVFDNIDNSTNCLKQLKTNEDILVKYAHYRLYFTINGLEDSTDYNEIKQSHIDLIKENTNSDVLYYKLYKKNKETYLGCGDLTIDTKEGMDRLLEKEEHKTFSLNSDQYTGQFYQYNKFRNSNERYDDEDNAPQPYVVKTKTEPVVNTQ
jgi:hypothetical protein